MWPALSRPPTSLAGMSELIVSLRIEGGEKMLNDESLSKDLLWKI